MKRHMVMHLATAIGLCTAFSAHAHHSYGMFFDLCTSITLEGRVENVRWQDPHIWFDLTTDDGTAYRVEWTSPRNLRAAGIAIEALKAGDRVVVTGSPPRKPAVNVVSALSQIRRPTDGWNWTRALGRTPPDCVRG